MPVRASAVDYTGLFDGRPKSERYEQPKADKELATELQDWFFKAQQYRIPWERAWDLNRLYLKGDQLLAKHKITGEIVRLSTEDSRRLKAQNNVLRPTARSLIGKLSKMIPTYRVDPATTDFAEQEGAATGDMLLQFVRQKEDLDLIYTKLCEFLPWAGNAFAELQWDVDAGQEIGFCKVCNYFTYDVSLVNQPCPQCAQQRELEAQLVQQETDVTHLEVLGDVMESTPQSADLSLQEVSQGIPVPPAPQKQLGPLPPGADIPLLAEAREGDVRVVVRDPRDIFIPPGCIDIKDATRICVRELVEVSVAARRFPQFAPFFYPDAQVESATSGAYRYQGSGSTGGWEVVDDHILIYMFHEAPTVAYQHGRVIFMINGVIVQETESPYYKMGRFPFFHFGFDPVGGEFYRDAFISQAWHRQKALNKLETQLDEHVDQVLRFKLLNPFGSRIADTEFNADTAQVISYNPAAGEPKPLQVGQISPGVWQRRIDLVQDIRNVASVTEAESGIMGSDPNGRAAAIINAEADQQVGPIVHRNNSEWKELHRGILILFQQYGHPERIATITGPEGLCSAYFSSLLNLKPGWDVRMEQEDSLSRNPAIRLTQAENLAQLGFFLDAQTGMLDKKAFARYAKINVPKNGADVEASERAAAAQIPMALKEGKQWQPRTFDVPMIFKDVLEGWLRGPGRQEDAALSMQVEQIWQYYTQWAMSGMPPAQGVPGAPGGGGASPAGSDGSAPGGTPNATGRIASTVGGEAQGQVRQADATGENLARSAAKHES